MRIGKGKQFLITLAAFFVLGISFKVMVLVEGLTEVRPVNAIPPVAGLICGPIGAAVCGIGNLLADMAGTFSASSALGVIGNFLAAYLPYRLWNLFSDEEPNLHSGRNIVKYCVISAICAMTVSWILAFGLYIMQGIWLEQIYTYVFFNNLGFSIGLGMPLFIILTSDSVRIECCRFTGKNYILEQPVLRQAVCVGYAGFMLLLFTGVEVWHFNPAEIPWMLSVSAAAAVSLIVILI